ncbi:FAD dependent oxidoreductase [Radiomyces spectabilis]|uniref:FAD dependent oxidoreductase n=1 Tax=Radiomyces spectabilis TaxID=64574 RepID=UPI00221FBE98|nr:FAD dependent oxidoreductase [Radiomyces spectabilis]KAI8388466.1 FAD dependent oxidoreductase [Radiomyces spectabilis]
MHLSSPSTPSYWLHEAPYQLNSENPLPAKADIVIVGAGLTGMSAAYWLTQMRPELSVVVVDARGVSSGATGRNGGIICPGLNDDFEDTVNSYGMASAERLVNFDYRNVEWLDKFLRQHADNDKGTFDPELTWMKHGTIVAWSNQQEADESRERAEQLARSVSDMRVLSPEELQAITGIKTYKYGGLQIKTTAIAWAAKIVFCLARAVEKKVIIATHTRVDRVENEGPVNRVITSRGVIETPKVAFCTNAWTQHLVKSFHNYLVPVRNQVVSVRAPENMPPMDYVLSANRGYQYMSRRPNGDLIMGGMRDIVPNKQEHEDDDSVLNLAVSSGLRDFMRNVMQVPVAMEREWVGVMGFSMRDGLPFVGSLEKLTGKSGQFVAAGFTGHGMPRTFLCGRAIAQILTDQELESWFPTEFLVDHPSRAYLSDSTGSKL